MLLCTAKLEHNCTAEERKKLLAERKSLKICRNIPFSKTAVENKKPLSFKPHTQEITASMEILYCNNSPVSNLTESCTSRDELFHLAKCL